MVSSVLSAHRWDTRDMVLFALFTALIAIGAFIRIPVPFCPFTLQYCSPPWPDCSWAAAAAPPRWPSTSS